MVYYLLVEVFVNFMVKLSSVIAWIEKMKKSDFQEGSIFATVFYKTLNGTTFDKIEVCFPAPDRVVYGVQVGSIEQ